MMPPQGAPPPPPGVHMPAPGGAQGGGTGAATTAGPMAGAQQSSHAAIKMGLEAFQKALVGVPMGSELHTALLKAITDVSKNFAKEGSAGGQDQSAMIQQLAQMARQQQQGPNPMAGMMPGGVQPPAMQ